MLTDVALKNLRAREKPYKVTDRQIDEGFDHHNGSLCTSGREGRIECGRPNLRLASSSSTGRPKQGVRIES